MKIFGYLLFAVIFASVASAAGARERCGWLINSDTDTWSLTDVEKNWVISTKQGYEAEDFTRIGDIYSGEYMPLNKFYGYACACLDVMTNEEDQVSSIQSFKQLPLAVCEGNDSLMSPEQSN